MLKDLVSRYTWPAERPALPVDLGPVWYLAEEIGHTKPIREAAPIGAKIVLELGSFVGRSTSDFLNISPDAVIIAIDTWEGSVEHQADPAIKAKLPQIYDQFLSNLWDYRDRVIPLRDTTLEGMKRVAKNKVVPDWIYVDANHTEAGVIGDILAAVKHFPTAKIIGDDWKWDSVRAGVEKVAAQLGRQIGVEGTVWWFKN